MSRQIVNRPHSHLLLKAVASEGMATLVTFGCAA
jgi:hypothetical protein